MPVIHRPSHGWSLSIGGKVVVLFLAFALAGAGSWLVMHRTMAQLDGAATDINLYGSLRYLSQNLQVVLHGATHGHDADVEAERIIAEFESTLESLERGRVAAEMGSTLAAVRKEWTTYRNAARHFLQVREKLPYPDAELHRLSLKSYGLLVEANRATWALSNHITGLQGKARAELAIIALVDALVLALAFFYVRRRIARPLHDLADVSRRFAGGDHRVRSGFRSRDEIGLMAESFDFMAAEIERQIATIVADLEAIRRKEVELRKLTQAVEHSPAAVIITDATGTIEYVNPRFSEVTGYAPEEALGRKPSMLQSGETLPETYRELWRTISSGAVWRGELLNCRKNGELFWENTQISTVRDTSGEIAHFVAVKEDVTARKRAEQALALLNVELEQRVAARTRQLEAANRELQAFTHSVSFDLRTPLRAIRGFAQAIEEEGGDRLDDTLQDYLRRIQAAAVRMGELIDDLLALGRVGQMEFVAQPVDLSRKARAILDELARRDTSRRVETVVEPGIVVDGDDRLLGIALENLLGNAWKFTAERDGARIVFERARDWGGNVVRVRDNGVGFNMAYAEKLFQPFQRLHAAGRFEGTGIGLATVKRVIDLHGGRVWADSAPDEGASFCFEIPDLPPDEGLAREDPAHETGMAQG